MSGTVNQNLLQQELGHSSDRTSRGSDRMMWFSTWSLLVAIMSAYGCVATLLNGEAVESLEFVYLFTFCVVIIVQSPQSYLTQIKIVQDIKRIVEKYFAAIIRFVFKGAYFVFIG